MSKTLRMEAADDNGYIYCYTCYRRFPWKEMQAGHYVNKSFGFAAYFDERNIRPQCESCNVFKEGNRSAYALHLLSDHGREYLETLERLKHVVTKNYPFQEKIYEWQARLDKAKQRFTL